MSSTVLLLYVLVQTELVSSSLCVCSVSSSTIAFPSSFWSGDLFCSRCSHTPEPLHPSSRQSHAVWGPHMARGLSLTPLFIFCALSFAATVAGHPPSSHSSLLFVFGLLSMYVRLLPEAIVGWLTLSFRKCFFSFSSFFSSFQCGEKGT